MRALFAACVSSCVLLGCGPADIPSTGGPLSAEPETSNELRTALLDIFVDCDEWGDGVSRCLSGRDWRSRGARERATGIPPPPSSGDDFERSSVSGRRFLRIVETAEGSQILSADSPPFLCRGSCALRDDSYEIVSDEPLRPGAFIELRENGTITLWGTVLGAKPARGLPRTLEADWKYATELLRSSHHDLVRYLSEWPLRVQLPTSESEEDVESGPLYDPLAAWNRGDVAGYLWMRALVLRAHACAVREGRAVMLPRGVAPEALATSSVDVDRFFAGLFIGLDRLRGEPVMADGIEDRRELDLRALALSIVDAGRAGAAVARFAALAAQQELDDWHRARAGELVLDLLALSNGGTAMLGDQCWYDEAPDAVVDLGVELAMTPRADWSHLFVPRELSFAWLGEDDLATDRAVRMRLAELAR